MSTANCSALYTHPKFGELTLIGETSGDEGFISLTHAYMGAMDLFPCFEDHFTDKEGAEMLRCLEQFGVVYNRADLADVFRMGLPHPNLSSPRNDEAAAALFFEASQLGGGEPVATALRALYAANLTRREAAPFARKISHSIYAPHLRSGFTFRKGCFWRGVQTRLAISLANPSSDFAERTTVWLREWRERRERTGKGLPRAILCPVFTPDREYPWDGRNEMQF